MKPGGGGEKRKINKYKGRCDTAEEAPLPTSRLVEGGRLLCGVCNADVSVTPQLTAIIKRRGKKFGWHSVSRGMQEENYFSLFFFNATISKAPLSAAALYCPRQQESIFSASSSLLLTESEKTAAKGYSRRGSGGRGGGSFFVPFFFLKFHLKLTY